MPGTWASTCTVAGETTVAMVWSITVTSAFWAVATLTGGGGGGFLWPARSPAITCQAMAIRINPPSAIAIHLTRGDSRPAFLATFRAAFLASAIEGSKWLAVDIRPTQIRPAVTGVSRNQPVQKSGAKPLFG